MLEILLENAVVALALAVVVAAICRLFRFGPAARHALWLVVLVKLLSPVGLIWSLPLPFERPPLPGERPQQAAPRPEPQAAGPVEISEGPLSLSILLLDSPDANSPEASVGENEGILALGSQANEGLAPANVQETGPDVDRAAVSIYFWLVLVWLAGALLVASRFVTRTARFSRYARAGKLASPSLQRQVAEMAQLLGVRAPSVRVLDDLPSPVVWCLFRPVLLWPKGLQDQLNAGGRRAVLAHELAHLRRRDHWVRWLELAAEVLHWWNPLFWLARRQIRFHAELACDAWVTGMFPETRRDYAEALLEVCARSSRAVAPSPAVGVGGDGRRDFQRRLTMIMRDHVPCRLAAGAKLFVVLLLTAALPAWTLGQARFEPGSEKKAEPKIEIKRIELNDLRFEVQVEPEGSKSDARKKVSDIEAKIAELSKQIELLKAAKAATEKGPGVPVIGWRIVEKGKSEPGQSPKGPIAIEIKDFKFEPTKPRYKVVGPDGKEIPGAKVIVLEPNPSPMPPSAQAHFEEARKRMTEMLSELQRKTPEKKEGWKSVEVQGGNYAIRAMGDQVINLTRATYPMPKEKAAALAAFLKENVKARVLEVSVAESGLTVTTTPEVQSSIGGIAKLMSQGAFFMKFQMPMKLEYKEMERVK